VKLFLTLMTVTGLPFASYSAEPTTTSEDVLAERARSVTITRLLSTVPPEQRIVIPAVGATLAHLVVFVDTNCSYCRQLHGLADAITRRGIEIDYIFYPRSGPSADSYFQAVAVWCSTDRLAALEDVFRGERLPIAHCDHPVMAHYALALELDLKGTPAIITPDGVVAYGVPSRDKLDDSDQY
jgi:thiol:disulfide interchange protein DsbC